MKRALLLIVIAGCSANDPPSNETDGGDASAVDSGFDAQSQCSPVDPHSGACEHPGQTCFYDFDDAGFPDRCDCVAPENVWICCRQFPGCAHTEDAFPWTAEGQPCCAGDGVPFVSGNSCALCYEGGHQERVACTSKDRHWRKTSETCNRPFPDAGPDAPADDSAVDPADAGTD